MVDKSEEKQIGEFFLEDLNRISGRDYVIELNNKEGKKDPDIDLYVKSSSGNYPLFGLQIVVSDGEIRRECGRLKNITKKTGQNVVMGCALDCPFEKWISNEIKKKESHYPSEVKKNLVLLIKFDLSLFNENYAQAVFEKFKTSEFLGIYAINLPERKESSSHPHGGQIIEIKQKFKD